MIRRAAVVLSSLAFTTLVNAGTAGAGPQLATERNRREALQVYRIGMELMSREQFEKAAEQFSRAIAKDPLLTRAHYGAGQAYMALRRYASAVKSYSECLEAFRALHGLQVSHRFEVEQQRDDEMRELRETIRSLTQSGQGLRAVQAEGRLRDLERQKTTLEGPYQPPAAVLLALGSALVSRWEHRRGDRAVAGGGGRRPEAGRGAQQSRGRLSAGGSPRRRGPRNEARGEKRTARESPVQGRPQESIIETLTPPTPGRGL